MKISIHFSEDRVKGLLCSAFEGGSNYWASIDSYKFPKGTSHEDFKEGGKFQMKGNYWHPCQIIPLVEGCSVIIAVDEETNKKKHVLNIEAIHKGFDVMAKKYPKHFGDFLAMNDDATTGDVFLQCCLFGELVYG